MKVVYLDNNATTAIAPEVFEAMTPYLTAQYANPSSQYSFAHSVREAVETSRESIATSLKIKSSELIFTGSGTESANLAIKGVAYAYRSRGNHIITSEIEHPCVLESCKALEKEGFEVTYLPVNKEGEISIEALKSAITDKTILISIMFANNEIGAIQPIKKIGDIAREHKILFHVDAVQSVGKMPVFPKELNVDLLGFAAHKFYGPKGIGGLYIRNGVRLEKYISGGHQERNRRPGTESAANVVGMAKALELCINTMVEEGEKERELRDYLETELTKRIPECFINAKNSNRIPGTSSITFKYVEGESILLSLDMYGICVSSGSACSAGDLAASHVILGIGVPIEEAQGTIRFGVGKYNTREDIDKVIEVMPKAIEKLRMMSPLYNVK
ncbi:MAG: cysteine desulfurase NifS [Fusobacteria bacterium]|nr:cysteine desulfurase NifS [Fusobacteriota bacterium]